MCFWVSLYLISDLQPLYVLTVSLFVAHISIKFLINSDTVFLIYVKLPFYAGCTIMPRTLLLLATKYLSTIHIFCKYHFTKNTFVKKNTLPNNPLMNNYFLQIINRLEEHTTEEDVIIVHKYNDTIGYEIELLYTDNCPTFQCNFHKIHNNTITNNTTMIFRSYCYGRWRFHLYSKLRISWQLMHTIF